MIGVTQGVLAPVQKPIDYNAHYGQSVFVCGGEYNFVRMLTTHIEAVTAYYGGPRQCDQNRPIRP
jgi:hypothetical protein